jgi:hypothetical protein
MRVLVENHQSGVLFFINKEILVNLPLIQVIMTVMILDYQAAVKVVFLQGKKVERVKKGKEKNCKAQTIKSDKFSKMPSLNKINMKNAFCSCFINFLPFYLHLT